MSRVLKQSLIQELLKDETDDNFSINGIWHSLVNSQEYQQAYEFANDQQKQYPQKILIYCCLGINNYQMNKTHDSLNLLKLTLQLDKTNNKTYPKILKSIYLNEINTLIEKTQFNNYYFDLLDDFLELTDYRWGIIENLLSKIVAKHIGFKHPIKIITDYIEKSSYKTNLNKDHLKALYYRSLFYYKIKEKELALLDLQQIEKQQPHNNMVLLFLAKINEEIGNYKKGLLYNKRAYKIGNNSTITQNNLALARSYNLLKKYEKSKLYYEQAKEYDTNHQFKETINDELTQLTELNTLIQKNNQKKQSELRNTNFTQEINQLLEEQKNLELIQDKIKEELQDKKKSIEELNLNFTKASVKYLELLKKNKTTINSLKKIETNRDPDFDRLKKLSKKKLKSKKHKIKKILKQY
ncbi:hypothetical protein M0813_08136 [Anaeramoeba flamelloides]|uniref:Uncharacterized protein n=1 Tax=Anaeramoeba flamelloides TaxID=1746091 RepID=A0ABQ8XAW3_9EUKA|nr:hypothetical protein M0813_08136 [Anaeramoeba flamelloides]